MIAENAQIYITSLRGFEQTLKKTTPLRGGGSLRRPGANLTVSATVRMLPSRRDRLKPNSIYRVGSTGRDVVWRRWTLTTHDMDDLRDRTTPQSDARKKLGCTPHGDHVDASEEVFL
mgnify:CR=1 FL=1